MLLKRGIQKQSNKTEVIKDGKSLGVFNSASEIDRISLKIFGVKLHQSVISKICKEGHGEHKGFKFKYADNKEYNQAS